ncbi:MAG: SDR family oxidoreductase [bacterium]|nr:SDR family oxidoreductase [bacterium]
MSKDLLTGKICIVTGGTQGLGKGIALHLAEKEAEGIIICGRNTQNGETSARELREIGCSCEYVQADLSVEKDCRNIVKKCDEMFGCVDGLVNAAGITKRGTLDNTTMELWDEIFAVNVRAPFILMQEVVRIMKREQHGGSIVNILSDTYHGGKPYITPYAASKGALATLTKNVAHSIRFEKIRANGIAMGWTATTQEHLNQKFMGESADWLEKADAEQPFGRLLRPFDIAAMVAYLLSDQSEMMTGALIDFDQKVMGTWD